MKALLLAALAVIATQAMATGPDEEFGGDIYYESWCEGDSVMTETEDQGIIRLFDCYESSPESDRMTCKETPRRVGDQTVVSATCS